MNYADLCTNIEDICENTFTADQLAMFVQQAEQRIFNTVTLPSLKKTKIGALGVGTPYLTLPDDFLSAVSMSVVDGDGVYSFLLFKDSTFMREAYPDPSATGVPKYYAVFGPPTGSDAELAVIVAPTPDQAYTMEFQYNRYPPSIVTEGTTWLGDNFDSALLNGSLVEAIRFMKGEADLVAFYEKMYLQAIALLKNLGDGKLRQDTYRAGEPRVDVN